MDCYFFSFFSTVLLFTHLRHVRRISLHRFGYVARQFRTVKICGEVSFRRIFVSLVKIAKKNENFLTNESQSKESNWPFKFLLDSSNEMILFS